jgi:hypothetical protein
MPPQISVVDNNQVKTRIIAIGHVFDLELGQ